MQIKGLHAMKDRMVWVEQDAAMKHAVRIFKNRKDAIASRLHVVTMLRSIAVKDIRDQIMKRAGGYDELSGEPITARSGHMHEQKHRGKGGEISLDNSVGISQATHRRAHADRNPHFSKRG